MPKKSYFLLPLAVLLIAGVSSCALPYKPDIHQGNIITQEMLNQLKPGMTARQVRFILGTPLVSDPFRQDRWDYYFYLKKGNKSQTRRRAITILFKDGYVTEVRDTAVPDPNALAQESGIRGAKQETTHHTEAL